MKRPGFVSKAFYAQTAQSNAAAAYQDTVERILNPNQDIPFRFTVEEKKKGFLSKLFRKK